MSATLVTCPCPGEAARLRREYRVSSAFKIPERAGKVARVARAIARVLLSANLEPQTQVRNCGGHLGPLLPSGHRLWIVRHVRVLRSAAEVPMAICMPVEHWLWREPISGLCAVPVDAADTQYGFAPDEG